MNNNMMIVDEMDIRLKFNQLQRKMIDFSFGAQTPKDVEELRQINKDFQELLKNYEGEEVQW